LHDKRLRAITAAEAVAEFKAKDEEAMNACVEDLTKVAQLDAETAKKIAVAYRNQVAPELLHKSGVDEARIANVVGTRTANFADVLEMKKKD
ncbi:hypothetical protein, partial [Streptomyces galilaeus]|uniref:hypothetical protein n=1 Tax=Streptomyces galilaeus TaxID=33899 RepID=UPI0038F7584E